MTGLRRCRVDVTEVKGSPEEELEKEKAKKENRPPRCPIRYRRELIAWDLRHAAIPSEMIGFAWPTTLIRRPALALSDLTVAKYKELRTAATWQWPRMFANGGELRPLVLDADEDSTRAWVRRAFQRANFSVLPRKMRELCFKVLCGGFLTGERKGVNAAKRGDTPEHDGQYCRHCLRTRTATRTRRQRPEWVESVSHMFHTCPFAQAVWQKALRWWEQRTGERLCNTARVTVLGERLSMEQGMGEQTCLEDLEEPFVFLRALVLEAIWKEREKERKSTQPRSCPQKVFSKIQVHMGQLATARLQMCRILEQRDDAPEQQEEVATFLRQWVKSGLMHHLHGSKRRGERIVPRQGRRADDKNTSRGKKTGERACSQKRNKVTPAAHVPATRFQSKPPSSTSLPSSPNSSRVAPRVIKRPPTHDRLAGASQWECRARPG